MSNAWTAAKAFCKKYTIVPILAIIFVVFSIFGKSFFTLSNFSNILTQSAIYGTMAVGMTFLIVDGFFDLSAGVVMGLTANIVILFQMAGFPIWASVAIAIVVSFVIGVINGALVAKVGINAFIVTLAMMVSMRGVTYMLNGSEQLAGTIKEFGVYGSGEIGGVSFIGLTFLALLLIGYLVLHYTRHGRDTFALGGSEEAAFNAGIKVGRVKAVNFVICSLMAGVAGVMNASKMNAATPYLGYPDGSIMVITCVVLGGTSLAGGSGGMLYTLGGTIAYFMLRNGLNMMNVPSSYYYMVTGLILIAVVTAERVQEARRARKVSQGRG